MTAARSLRGPARGALVGGRRGRRRRELRRPAPHAAQRAVGRRPERGGPRDLVVGELRLGDHLPPARRPLHPPERRRRRAVAARSRRRRGDVHAEPDQPGRRAADRGELGARRGRRRRPRDPRHASASTAPARCSSAHPASRRSRSAPRPTAAPSRRPSRRSSSSSSASTTISSRSSTRSPAQCERGVRTGARHRVGVRGRAALPAAVPRGDDGRVVTAADRAGATSGPVEVIERVPLFANMSPRDVEGIAALFKERRFAAGETITKEGAGGAAFFVIESGEATVTIGGRQRATLDERRLLRRDRAHRRRRTLGDGHREQRPRLLRAHLLGVPTARAAERNDRLEPAPDAGQAAAHRAGRPAGVAAVDVITLT